MVIEKLATSLGRRDETPNVELAKDIVRKKDKKAVNELLDNLSNSNKGIRNDCVKVLYEIGGRNPTLIGGSAKVFLRLLDSSDTRLVWGAMTALDSITLEEPKAIVPELRKIIKIADQGSVITRDHAVSMLTKLASLKQYSTEVLPLLIQQLRTSPTNQLPMYAEKALPIIDGKNRTTFIRTLSSRLDEIEKTSKRKRVERVIGKAETIREF